MDAIPSFADMLIAARGYIPKLRIVGIDPGETTGITTYQDAKQIRADQLNTKSVPEGAARVEQYIIEQQPNIIVMEEYKVYGWKASSHAWSTMHTSRLIGAIEYIAHINGIPVIFQGAGEAKGFSTDEKLKAWGFYQTSMRHANDSIRHACHALLFSKHAMFGPLKD